MRVRGVAVIVEIIEDKFFELAAVSDPVYLDHDALAVYKYDIRGRVQVILIKVKPTEEVEPTYLVPDASDKFFGIVLTFLKSSDGAAVLVVHDVHHNDLYLVLERLQFFVVCLQKLLHEGGA